MESMLIWFLCFLALFWVIGWTRIGSALSSVCPVLPLSKRISTFNLMVRHRGWIYNRTELGDLFFLLDFDIPKQCLILFTKRRQNMTLHHMLWAHEVILWNSFFFIFKNWGIICEYTNLRCIYSSVNFDICIQMCMMYSYNHQSDQYIEHFLPPPESSFMPLSSQ